jgi:excisionase family DNA binding protein
MAPGGYFGHLTRTSKIVHIEPTLPVAREEARHMNARTPDAEPLLTPAEVATMFRVDPKTVTRWAKAGKLTSIRTLGGHRRYRETEVRALLQGSIPQQQDRRHPDED